MSKVEGKVTHNAIQVVFVYIPDIPGDKDGRLHNGVQGYALQE